MIRKGLFDQVPSGVWKKDWNVNIQVFCPICDGRLKYQCSILPFQRPPVEDNG
jgi:hypothetical protein